MRISDWSSDVCSSDLRKLSEEPLLPWNLSDKTRVRKHPLYRVYYNMIYRCYVEGCSQYEYYGGRGIKVCDRWLQSFADFAEDIGPRPSKSHSIDRFPDTDGNYEPGNCRWATPQEQASKDRKSVGEGKSDSVRVDRGGRRINKKKK